jgi:hypothetical protein
MILVAIEDRLFVPHFNLVFLSYKYPSRNFLLLMIALMRVIVFITTKILAL